MPVAVAVIGQTTFINIQDSVTVGIRVYIIRDSVAVEIGDDVDGDSCRVTIVLLDVVYPVNEGVVT